MLAKPHVSESAMRRTVVTACLAIFAGALPAHAQRNSQPQTAVARSLFKLENDWTVGLVKRDTVLFKRITDPRFVYTEDAAIIPRADLIKGIATNPDRVESSHNEDMTVHEFGSTAIVTGILVVNSRGKKGAYTTRYRFTDTWQNKSGA
jgi:ketosteroid isomerase-like protein